MAKTYTCRNVGVDFNCKTTGATEDEVIALMSEHAAQIHPMLELTPASIEAVRGAIKVE